MCTYSTVALRFFHRILQSHLYTEHLHTHTHTHSIWDWDTEYSLLLSSEDSVVSSDVPAFSEKRVLIRPYTSALLLKASHCGALANRDSQRSANGFSWLLTCTHCCHREADSHRAGGSGIASAPNGKDNEIAPQERSPLLAIPSKVNYEQTFAVEKRPVYKKWMTWQLLLFALVNIWSS